MTGYGRATGSTESLAWQWEMKSVNGRNLDMRVRLPNGFDAIEPDMRKILAAHFQRGHINVQLQLDMSGITDDVKINDAVLEQYLTLIENLSTRMLATPPQAEAILGLKGVAETSRKEPTAEDLEKQKQALTASFADAAAALKSARREEGQRLLAVLDGHLTALSDQCRLATERAALQPEQRLAWLHQQLKALKGEGLSEERLHQEAALLATKVDVTEELDRLHGHIRAIGELLEKGGAIGRKLDFLSQELNREANTLCAKSQDLTLTHIGVEMKRVIDQFKEQVQNLE